MRSAVRRAMVVTGALVIVSGPAAGVAAANARPPVLAFSPAPFDYGQVTVGQTPAPSQVFTLTNTGGSASGPLTVTVAGSAAFTITQDTCTRERNRGTDMIGNRPQRDIGSRRAATIPPTWVFKPRRGIGLAPGKSCTVTVQFAPTATGLASATLTAVGMKRVVTATDALTGTGVLTGIGAPACCIYWANDGEGAGATIGRANLDGSGVNQSFITGASEPNGVAVNGSHIYWANRTTGTIGRANLDGTGVNEFFITGADRPDGVAVDGSHIYWANDEANGTIGRANLDGTGVDQYFITGADDPTGVAVDSSHIYWGNFNSIGEANVDGTGVNQNLIAGVFPAGLAVDASHIYWSDADTFGIGEANLDGTDVFPGFITGANGPFGVAVDASNIYWANQGTSTIGEANLDGTGVNQSFITGASFPAGVAVSP
jgi:virginiamycin B lyase